MRKIKKKKGQNLNGYKIVIEGLWKGILCMVKLAKIGMDFFKVFLKKSFKIKKVYWFKIRI